MFPRLYLGNVFSNVRMHQQLENRFVKGDAVDRRTRVEATMASI